MNPLEFALAALIVICAARIIRHYLRIRENGRQQEPAHQVRLEALEQRVRTLEKIVTDEGYDLKREFDKL